MPKNEIAVNEIARAVENYLTYVLPQGDWRYAKHDTPIMSRFVMEHFTTKACKPTKYDYHNDVIDAITDNNKLAGMATEKLRALDTQMVNVVKTLAADTVNIHGQTTTALLCNELRREFIQAQHNLMGSQVNPGDKVTELPMEGVDSDVIVKTLASLNAVELFNSVLVNMNDNIVDALPFIGALIARENNQGLLVAFRQMCTILEMFGVLKPIITSLHDAAKMIAGSGVNVTTNGVTVGGNNTNAKFEPTMSSLMNSIGFISNTFEPYGKQAVQTVYQMLSMATPSDITDIESIIKCVPTTISNYERYIGAVSTAFSLSQVPAIIQQSPKNITVALLYICKMNGDITSNRSVTSGEVAQILSNVIGDQVVASPNYRVSIANAISYDMDVKNANTTMALSKMLGINPLYTFAQSFLSCDNSPQPLLTREAMIRYVGQSSLHTSAVTIADVDGFLKSKGYDIGSSVPTYKNELLNAIVTAVNGR